MTLDLNFRVARHPAAVAITSNTPTSQNDFVVSYAGLIFEFCRKRFIGSYFFFKATRRS
jgi:hypothetical protein